MARDQDLRHRSLSAINARIASFLHSLESIPGILVEYRSEDDGTSHFFDLSLELGPLPSAATLLPAAEPSTGEEDRTVPASPVEDLPEPEPVSEPAPEVEAPAPEPVAAARSKPALFWTPERDAELRHRLKLGQSFRRIANALGAKRVGPVAMRAKQLGIVIETQSTGEPVRAADKSDRTTEARDEGVTVVQAPTAGERHLPKSLEPPAAFGASLDRLRSVLLRLDHCRDPDWTDAQDHFLIEGLSLGRKLATIATTMKKPQDLVKARFRRLCPDPSMEAQALLIKALLHRLALAKGVEEVSA